MRKGFIGIVLVLGIILSACSQKNSSFQFQPSDPWVEGRTTVVSRGGAVVIGNVNQDLIVVLDDEYHAKTKDVVVSAVELFDSYLVETVDPSGRFLPSIQVITKELRPLLKVNSLQLDASEEWNLKPLGDLEILPLTKASLGTASLGEVPDRLAQIFETGGVNILMPVGASFDERAEYEIFQTPGSYTVVLLPADFRSSTGSGLMAQTMIEDQPWFAISADLAAMQSIGIPQIIQRSAGSTLS